jgi:RNA polymerase sigma-70 factor (ECF subfamily)
MVLFRFPSKRTALVRAAFDGAYLERLRLGDPETERHFFAYFGELIVIKVRARNRTAHAEDVRQETFLRVLKMLRSPNGLRDPGALGAFVNSVCNNVLYETDRSSQRHQAPAAVPDPVPDEVTPDAESQLITEERTQAVRRVLQDLTPKDRQVLRALFLEERDKSAICEQLGVTREYLRVLVHRAKNAFRALYEQREQKLAQPAASDALGAAARKSVG